MSAGRRCRPDASGVRRGVAGASCDDRRDASLDPSAASAPDGVGGACQPDEPTASDGLGCLDRDGDLKPCPSAAGHADPPLAPSGAAEPAAPALPVPERGAPEAQASSLASRVALQLAGRHVELQEGTTVVGRSRRCDVSIIDPHVSRRHASFSYVEGKLAVQNLSASSRIRVNGDAVHPGQRRDLQIGDRVQLGAQSIEVCFVGDYNPTLEPTRRWSEEPDVRSATEGATTLAMVTDVAAKYVLLGLVREAERVAWPVLDGLLSQCEAGRAPEPADVQLATDLALQLADATHAGSFVDYVFDLHSALGQPLANDVVERLIVLIPTVQAISMSRYRACLAALDAVAERFGPAQRFLLRRLHGLRSRLLLSAHV